MESAKLNSEFLKSSLGKIIQIKCRIMSYNSKGVRLGPINENELIIVIGLVYYVMNKNAINNTTNAIFFLEEDYPGNIIDFIGIIHNGNLKFISAQWFGEDVKQSSYFDVYENRI